MQCRESSGLDTVFITADIAAQDGFFHDRGADEALEDTGFCSGGVFAPSKDSISPWTPSIAPPHVRLQEIVDLLLRHWRFDRPAGDRVKVDRYDLFYFILYRLCTVFSYMPCD